MKGLEPHLRRRRGWCAAAAVLVAVAVYACSVSWAGTGALETVLRDDAYYFFQWARNLAQGRGPVVSDGVRTNGVQLLWAFLLVPCVWLWGGDALPERSMALGLLLHAATAALLVRAGGFRRTAWATGLIYAVNPFVLREALNGQETALACFLLAWLWLLRRAPPVHFLACAGLLLLARIDLFGFVLALCCWRWRWRGPGLAALTLAPVFVANLVVGGSWMAHSSAPLPWQVWDAFLTQGPDLTAWLQRLWWYLRPVLLGSPWQEVDAVGLGALVFLVVRPLWPLRLRWLPLVLVLGAMALGKDDLIVPLVVAVLLAVLPAHRRGRVPRLPLVLLTGVVLLLLLHFPLRQYPRSYYFAPLAVAGCIALLQLQRLRWLLLGALAGTLTFSLPRDATLPGQLEMAMAGRFLDLLVPTAERIGCFNSGIVTWLRRGPVVNLDGVVNPEAFAAARAHRLSEWLDGQDVRFVVDNPQQFERSPRVHATGRYFGPAFDAARDLVPMCSFDVPGVDAGREGTLAFVLYWRRGRGAQPGVLAQPRDLGRGPDGGRYVLWPGSAGAVLSAEQEGRRRDLVRAVDGRLYLVFVERHGPGAIVLRSSRALEPMLVLHE